jgi:hypothetical protein
MIDAVSSNAQFQTKDDAIQQWSTLDIRQTPDFHRQIQKFLFAIGESSQS